MQRGILQTLNFAMPLVEPAFSRGKGRGSPQHGPAPTLRLSLKASSWVSSVMDVWEDGHGTA